MHTRRDCGGHLQLENELLEVALGGLLGHDVAHLLAHRSDLRRLSVARLLDLVVLLLGEPDAGLDTHGPKTKTKSRKQRQGAEARAFTRLFPYRNINRGFDVRRVSHDSNPTLATRMRPRRAGICSPKSRQQPPERPA